MKSRGKTYVRLIALGLIVFIVGIFVGTWASSQANTSFIVTIPEMQGNDSYILGAIVKLNVIKFVVRFLRLFISRGDTRQMTLGGNATEVVVRLMEESGTDTLNLRLYSGEEDEESLLATITMRLLDE